MNTLGKCPHCGAPITTQIVLSGRIAVCEYCRSEFLLDNQTYEAIMRYNQEKRRLEYEEAQAKQVQTLLLQQENQNLADKITKRRVIAAIATMFGGGCFGIPSFICGHTKLGVASLIAMIICALANVAFGVISVILMFVIPIYSIINIKLK